jgi:PAS domain S-box-containing protein
MIDLTSRKRSEKAQRESEEKYRNILENIQEGYFETDLAGNFTFFSDSVCRIHGYPRKELMGMNNRQYTDKETAKKVFQAFNNVYRTGEPIKGFDWQIIRKDGSRRYIEASVSLKENSSGKPKEFRGILRDITERKHAEEKVLFEGERFRALADHSLDIIFLIDPKGAITYMNPSIERVLGYKIEERLWKSSLETIHPDDLPSAIDKLKILATDTNSPVLQMEMRLRHKDGSWRNFETVGSNLIKDNAVETIIIRQRDITEQKKAEESLRQSEEKYRTILENIQEEYWETDFKGNYIFFNDIICKQAGYSRKELMGMNSLNLSDEETSKRLFKICKKIHKTGEPARDLNWQITRKDGTRRDIEGSLFLLRDSSGKPIGFKGIAHDITERQRAEISLKQSEAQYRLLADHMKDYVCLMDLDLKIAYISPSAEKVMGYTQDEFKELPVHKLLTAASFKAAMDFFSMEMPKAMAAPPDYVLNRTIELEFLCKNGQPLWGETSFTLIRDENGKPVSLLGESRNITERKQMENELRATESNFRHSLDNSPLGVRISTKEGETIYANKAILDIYGYDNIEELKNTPLKERYTPDSFAEFQLRKKKRLRGELGPPEYEISIIRKNCEIRHLHVFRKEIFWNGKKQSQVIYQDITLRRQAEKKLNETLENLRKSIKTTIQVLGMASEARDPYTAGHQKKVADLARAIATEMKLPHDKIEGIRMAGAIHDIGKISIPSEILCKPSALSDLEFSLIKAHTQYSYEIMKDVESPWPLADIVYQHHERINGSGYPQGLKGEDILIEARILAVADVVEAMISYRPYRPALGVEIALEEIERNTGTLYDLKVADACLKLFREKGFKLE